MAKQSLKIDVGYFKQTGKIRSVAAYSYDISYKVKKEHESVIFDGHDVVIHYKKDSDTQAYKIDRISMNGNDPIVGTNVSIKVATNGFVLNHGKEQSVITGHNFNGVSEMLNDLCTKKVICYAPFNEDDWEEFDISGLDLEANLIGQGQGAE